MSTDGDTTSELTTLEQQIIMHLQNTFGDGTEENFPAEADIDRVQTAYANLSDTTKLRLLGLCLGHREVDLDADDVPPVEFQEITRLFHFFIWYQVLFYINILTYCCLI